MYKLTYTRNYNAVGPSRRPTGHGCLYHEAYARNCNYVGARRRANGVLLCRGLICLAIPGQALPSRGKRKTSRPRCDNDCCNTLNNSGGGHNNGRSFRQKHQRPKQQWWTRCLDVPGLVHVLQHAQTTQMPLRHISRCAESGDSKPWEPFQAQCRTTRFRSRSVPIPGSHTLLTHIGLAVTPKSTSASSPMSA